MSWSPVHKATDEVVRFGNLVRRPGSVCGLVLADHPRMRRSASWALVNCRNCHRGRKGAP